ncbi:related to SEC63-ER protein-translocation complex subunit [Sporisorium reilianum SRZ2]|uniref:Related to SEC63-ER protein-translocation complex subunit n=1 Tax=Sporisorium reilianum (strain SRZ2) TaxID=999809 RepID=E6ZW39_SPORE|nr:related to SEC63-ER protein-translocation complex subunit [Sporisorium reilianum SRZ2]
MAEYKYDEEGGQFLTFVLTFLLLVLVPLTYSLLSPSRTASSKKGSWDARGQKIDLIRSAKKRSLLNPQISPKAVFVLAGWGIVAYLFQTILNTASNSSHAVYDPFQILGIAASATEKEIKKHYKRLSVKFHPDKLVLAEGQTKEEVEGHYIELTKAYKALTDETIRKNFELYGHPDGKQEMSMGIALPRWVIESQNNIYVLGMYAVVLGVGLPFLVARWWYGSRSKTKDGIVNSTAQTYFQHLRDDTNASRIFALLAISDEFSDAKLDKLGAKHRDEPTLAKLETQIREKLAEFGPEWHLIDSFKNASIRKALLMLYAHTLRIDSGNKRIEQDKLRYAAKAVQLLNGLMSISLAHNWLETTLLLMLFTQCMVQAVPLQDLSTAELLQLPHMTPQLIKKLQDSNSLAKLGIQGFWKIPDAERKAVLTGAGVSAKQYKQMVGVTSTWPRVELVDAFFKVSGERLVTTGAIVQFVVKLRLLPPKKDGSLLRDGRRLDAKRMDEESSVRPDDDASSSTDTKKKDASAGDKDEGKQPIGFARAPYFWDERKPSWWVMIGDQKLDRVIVQPTKVSDMGADHVRTYSVQFQAPPQAGLYTFQAMLNSDSFLGSDASRMVKLKVEDASVLEADDLEDEISEPEEDSLAGQMALMKGQKVKPSRTEASDDDESGTDDDVAQDDDDSDSDSDSDSD